MIIPVITTISRFLRLTPVAANNIQTSHIQIIASMAIPMVLDLPINLQI